MRENEDLINKDHFDMEQLKDRIGNNKVILDRVLAMAKSNFENYLADPYLHLQTKNLKGIKDSAHKLKGTSLSLCFGVLAQLAGNLERVESFEENKITSLLQEIEIEITYLSSILKSF